MSLLRGVSERAVHNKAHAHPDGLELIKGAPASEAPGVVSR